MAVLAIVLVITLDPTYIAMLFLGSATFACSSYCLFRNFQISQQPPVNVVNILPPEIIDIEQSFRENYQNNRVEELTDNQLNLI